MTTRLLAEYGKEPPKVKGKKNFDLVIWTVVNAETPIAESNCQCRAHQQMRKIVGARDQNRSEQTVSSGHNRLPS